MSNGMDVHEHRIKEMERRMNEHEKECKSRAGKHEARFDGLDKRLVKIETILWVIGISIPVAIAATGTLVKLIS